MAFGYVLDGVHDLDVLSYYAVGYSFAAVDECAAHNDGVLYLRVSDGGVVSDAARAGPQ